MGRQLIEDSTRVCLWDDLIRDKKLSPKALLSARSICISFDTITSHSKITTHISETVYLTTSRTNFNGERVWFQCPDCWRRVGCFFVPPYSNRLLCRHCHNLAYSSQNRHRESVWECFHGPEHRRNKILKKLENKWLRTPTKEKLLGKLKALEVRASIPRQHLMGRLDRRLR